MKSDALNGIDFSGTSPAPQKGLSGHKELAGHRDSFPLSATLAPSENGHRVGHITGVGG